MKYRLITIVAGGSAFIVMALASLCFDTLVSRVEMMCPNLPPFSPFSSAKADLRHSIDNYKGDYEIFIIPIPSNHLNYNLSLVRDGNCVLTLRTHNASVFRIDGEMLYLADFDPYSSGCVVEAYDLDQGKMVWQRHLRSLGLVNHSVYKTRVNLLLTERTVQVIGKESNGDYIEVLDRISGTRVGHKIYSR